MSNNENKKINPIRLRNHLKELDWRASTIVFITGNMKVDRNWENVFIPLQKK